jgi:hypothetical protein
LKKIAPACRKCYGPRGGVAPKSRYHCAAQLDGIELPDDTLTGTAT